MPGVNRKLCRIHDAAVVFVAYFDCLTPDDERFIFLAGVLRQTARLPMHNKHNLQSGRTHQVCHLSLVQPMSRIVRHISGI